MYCEAIFLSGSVRSFGDGPVVTRKWVLSSAFSADSSSAISCSGDSLLIAFVTHLSYLRGFLAYATMSLRDAP